MPRKNTSSGDENSQKNVDFGSAISQICEEKGIAKDKVVETIEAALSAAYKKDYGKKGQNIKAIFDEVTGGAKFFLVKEVVDETTREFPVENEEEEKEEDKKEVQKKEIQEDSDEEKLPRFNPERDLTKEEAKKIKKDAEIGDVIEMELEMKNDYGRVAAQTAKQVIIQRIREAERDAMFTEYKNKEGEVLSGTIQRIEGRNVFVDLGKSVGVLYPSDQIARENYQIGQRIKVYLVKVDSENRGPGITLSRTNAELIRKLFELEVPEIFAGTVEIKSIAREPGERAKIAVFSSEEGIDPIGSCVGQKGTRVQAIIDELSGEKIDIILWDEDPVKFISSALSPAKVLDVKTEEENKHAEVSVLEDQLSLAIGKHGQNVRLAAKLTGWKIDINGVDNDGEKIEKEDRAGDTEKVEEKKAEEEKDSEPTESTKEDSKEKEELAQEKNESENQEEEKKESEEK